METLVQRRTYPFLQGGGEMGELTREFDWSITPVGRPDEWPRSLQTTVSNLLRSRFPMFLWWGDEMIQFYNDAYRPSMGNEGKHPKALGQRGKECWPEIWPIIYPLIEQVRITGEATWMEDQLVPIYRNGKIEDVYWTYSYSAVLDDLGNQSGILVTCTETTQKVNSFKQLAESNNQLEFAIEATELATWEYNPITNKITGNARLKQWFNIPPTAEVELSYALTVVIAKQDRERVSAAIQKALQYSSGGQYDIEYTIVHPATATERIVRAKGRAWFDENKLPYRFNGTLQDITAQALSMRRIEEIVERRTQELKLAQESLMQANGYLQQIINKFETALVSLVPVFENEEIIDFRFKMANATYSLYSHLSPEDTKGKKVGDVFPEYYQTVAFNNYLNTYLTGKPNNWELHYDVDGLDVHLDISVSKMDNELIVHFTDFTTLKNLQLDLLNKIQELERSNRSLEEFAYAASHDLKEPVRKIQFFGERIKKSLGDQVTHETMRSFERMENAAQRMNSLIDDLLTYSQISIGSYYLDEVNMNQLMDLVVEDLDLEIEAKGATIIIEKLFTIQGHHRQLQQAFQNLLSNALKYCKPGIAPKIHVGCRTILGKETSLHLPEEDQLRYFYCVTIRDNGIGFDPSDAERIFNVFTRLHGMAEYKGTGIGLSIVRKVVENHKGYIWAEAQPGEGSTFKVLLPVD